MTNFGYNGFIDLSRTGFNGIISSAFSPTQISGSVFYSDAQDSTKFTDVGGGVISEIINKTSAIKCSQVTGTKRAIRTANAINGKYGLFFDGTDDFYIGPSVVTGSYTKFITVFPSDLDTSTSVYNTISSHTGVNHQLAFFKSGLNLRIRDAFSTMAKDIPLTNGSSVFTLIETVESGSQKTYFNGVLIDTKTTVFSNTDSAFDLGAYNNGQASTFFKGYIGDFGIYNRALTSAEVFQIDTHQRSKYRLIVSNPIKILGIGQSNEKGTATLRSDNNTAYIGLEYDQDYKTIRDLKDSTGCGFALASNGSYHPPLVSKINALTSRKVIMVTSSKTGSSISSVASAGDNTAHWGSDGTLLRSTAVAKTNEMLSLTGGSLDWIIINQGERDASYMVSNPAWTGALYKAAYLDLINYFRALYPGVKFLIIKTVTARTAGTDTAANLAQSIIVQTAQQEIADSESDVFIISDALTFNTSGGQLESDGIHYNKSANLTIGNSAGTEISNNL